MIAVLLRKELKSILLSPKFASTFLVTTLLILLSIQSGITDYTTALSKMDAARALAFDEMSHEASWRNVSMTTFRPPDPVQVFVVGVANDVGRLSPINNQEPVNLRNSTYTDNPLFALFRTADFSFIVTVVLSLFAILFTYDAINGEREQGTLALTFSNAVSRAQYLTAKIAGTAIGLLLPLSLAVLLGLLMVVLEGVPLSASDWTRVLALLGLSFLLFLFFLSLGILISASTRNSEVSFLICLAVWIATVLVIPRAGMMVATTVIPVPSYVEIEGRRDAYAKDQWEEFNSASIQRWRDRERAMSSLTKDERDVYRDKHLAQWTDEEDRLRKPIQAGIEAQGRRLEEGWRLRQIQQQDLGFTLALCSPAAAYQLAAMTLAGTDPDMKERFESGMRDYRREFIAYTDRKQKESGGMGGMRITFDSNSGFKFSAPRQRGTLDLRDMPQYTSFRRSTGEVVRAVLPLAGIITAMTLFAMAGAIGVFFRYDLR